MECPFCGAEDTKVIDSRPVAPFEIRRRRSCPECEKRFTTVECRSFILPKVIKSSGFLESFDEGKLRSGLLRALVKRSMSTDDFEAMVHRILMSVHNVGSREILGKDIGEMVMCELAKIDMVAYVRFASVYQSFQDLSAFKDLIEELSTKKEEKDETTFSDT